MSKVRSPPPTYNSTNNRIAPCRTAHTRTLTPSGQRSAWYCTSLERGLMPCIRAQGGATRRLCLQCIAVRTAPKGAAVPGHAPTRLCTSAMRAPLHARRIDGTNKHASAHSVRVRTCGGIIVHALEEAHRDALRCPFLLLRACNRCWYR